MFRYVTTQSIYDAVLKRLGLDPYGDAITYDTARSIAEHLTERVNAAFGVWDWPEFMRTEERAYRQVWNDTAQYLRSNIDGFPDEVYYVDPAADAQTQFYFQVNTDAISDPPIGTVPTNTSYFTPMDTFEQYVGRDQPYQNPMGPVLEVFASDPSATTNDWNPVTVEFIPSERGITIFNGPPRTVFVQFSIESPQYTFVPFIVGKSYVKGDTVINVLDGQCYLCITDVKNALTPTDTQFWMLQPVPTTLAPYLKAGVYADCLDESWVGGDDAIRLQKRNDANTEADNFLYREIDDLLAQGQKHHYMQAWYRKTTWKFIEGGTVLVPVIQ